MKAGYGRFPSDWEIIAGTTIEYRKKISRYEMRATKREELCDKCGKRSFGFLYKTVESSGYDMESSEVYWCPKCGEGMTPEAYEKFVRTELLEVTG